MLRLLRVFRTAPGYAITATTTLAVGIGAATAIFSVVYGLVLKPLPYPAPGRLVAVWFDLSPRGGPVREWSGPAEYDAWREGTRVLSQVAAVRGWSPTLTGFGDPTILDAGSVTWEYFDLLGARPRLGRVFRSSDDTPEAERVVVVSDGFWRRQLGGRDDAIGRTLMLSGEPWTVIGVLPAAFSPALVRGDVWRPVRAPAGMRPASVLVQRVVARLADGVTFDEAAAALRALGASLAEARPEAYDKSSIAIEPLHDVVVGPTRSAALTVLAAVLLLLLVACANVASLMLARSTTQVRDVAVRAAMGAGRLRLAAERLLEAATLAVLGAAAGALCAVWGVDALVSLVPPEMARIDEIGLDLPVLAFAVGLTGVTTLAFGLVPAWQGTGGDPVDVLRGSGRSIVGGRGLRTRRVLVVIEIAVALVLLVGAGLLTRSLLQLRTVHPGFDARGVVTASVAVPRTRYPGRPEAAAFFARLIERLRATAGVDVAAGVSVLPFSGDDTDTRFVIDGRPVPQAPGDWPSAWYRQVTPDYFRALRIPIVRGRGFTDADRAGAPIVVLVNETLARRYWPSEDPVGRRIRAEGGSDAPWATIVGIVGDVRHRRLDEPPEGELYLSEWQYAVPFQTIVLRGDASQTALIGALTAAVRSIDPGIPVSAVARLDDLLDTSVRQPRSTALLVVAFSVAALLLAALGVYGLMTYTVSLRSSELAVRLALGAERTDIARLVARESMTLALLGLGAGLVAAGLSGRVLASQLFGVAPHDAPTIACSAVVLAVVVAAATVVPVVAATRVEAAGLLRR